MDTPSSTDGGDEKKQDSSAAAILAVLAFWFVSCAFFNDLTPRMIVALNGRSCLARGEEGHVFCPQDGSGPSSCGECGSAENGCMAPSGDCLADGTVGVTMIELTITIAIASTKLLLEGQRVFIPMAVLPRMSAIGALHLGGCRLFLWSLGQGIPVALAQTIRAMNPLFTVLLGLVLGNTYRPVVLATLVPVIVGFCIAVTAAKGGSDDGGDGGAAAVEEDAAAAAGYHAGVMASIGSVCCLVCVNTLSKAVLNNTSVRVSSGELQCWSCTMALLFLTPYWAQAGGYASLQGAFALDGSYEAGMIWNLVPGTLANYCVLDGICYFSEQVAQFAAIGMLLPLTFAVVDTTRRLWIVIVSGFILQGNPFTVNAVAGAALVCAGAGSYAVVVSKERQEKKE